MKETVELHREIDGGAFNLLFTGGLRTSKKATDKWFISPVKFDDKPCAKGPYTKNELQRIARDLHIVAIAFQEIGWNGGEYNSHWQPILPSGINNSTSAANTWGKIASNIGNARNEGFFRSTNSPSEDEIAQIFDEHEPSEAAARYISYTLRGLDVSIEQVADYYNEQLVNDIAAGSVNGEQSDSTRSNSLYAHVHAFFLHIGMARDYLATLIAHQIGLDDTNSHPRKKTDSMAKLVDRMRKSNLPENEVLAVLFEVGDIVGDPRKPDRFQTSG